MTFKQVEYQNWTILSSLKVEFYIALSTDTW